MEKFLLTSECCGVDVTTFLPSEFNVEVFTDCTIFFCMGVKVKAIFGIFPKIHSMTSSLNNSHSTRANPNDSHSVYRWLIYLLTCTCGFGFAFEYKLFRYFCVRHKVMTNNKLSSHFLCPTTKEKKKTNTFENIRMNSKLFRTETFQSIQKQSPLSPLANAKIHMKNFPSLLFFFFLLQLFLLESFFGARASVCRCNRIDFSASCIEIIMASRGNCLMVELSAKFQYLKLLSHFSRNGKKS